MTHPGFIDIHSHILPKLDEGPACLNESVNMLRIAREDGISGIVATPHVMDGVYNNSREDIREAITELGRVYTGVQVYMGAEIRINRNLLERLGNNELPLLNDGNFVLLELPTYVLPPLVELEKIVRNIKTLNINPIFVHPERNIPILNDLSIMERLICCGAAFQVTAMSITGHFGKRIQKAVLVMIKKGYAHVVASDAHDAEKRPPILSQGYEAVAKKFGTDTAHRLFKYNPLKIISGEDLT